MGNNRKVDTAEWVSVRKAAEILGVHFSAVNDAVVKYDIEYCRMEGVVAYSVSDLKEAAIEIAIMRAGKRSRKQDQEQEVANA